MSELHGEVYYPGSEVVRGAHVTNHRSLWDRADADYQGFWEDRAKELTWDKGWDRVLDDSNPPFYRWFPGARTNIVTNCIDRHLSGPYKNKLALIWVGEDIKDVKTYSYFSLAREVDQMANVLRSMGVGKGDKVEGGRWCGLRGRRLVDQTQCRARAGACQSLQRRIARNTLHGVDVEPGSLRCDVAGQLLLTALQGFERSFFGHAHRRASDRSMLTAGLSNCRRLSKGSTQCAATQAAHPGQRISRAQYPTKGNLVCVLAAVLLRPPAHRNGCDGYGDYRFGGFCISQWQTDAAGTDARPYTGRCACKNECYICLLTLTLFSHHPRRRLPFHAGTLRAAGPRRRRRQHCLAPLFDGLGGD